MKFLQRRGIVTGGVKKTNLNFREESEALTRLLGDEKSS